MSQKETLQFPTVFAHLVLFFFTDLSCNSKLLSVTCFLVVFWNLSAAEFFSAVCRVCIRISGFISHVSAINSNYQQMIYHNEMSTNIYYVMFTGANHKILGLQVSSTWISNILTNFICTYGALLWNVKFLCHHLDDFWKFLKTLPFWILSSLWNIQVSNDLAPGLKHLNKVSAVPVKFCALSRILLWIAPSEFIQHYDTTPTNLTFVFILFPFHTTSSLFLNIHTSLTVFMNHLW